MTEPNEPRDARPAGASARAFESPERVLERLEADLDALERTLAAADPDPTERRQLFELLAGRLQDALAETADGHGAINTRSGGTITPLEPDPAAIELEDVAHALANLSRFAGQGKCFYSVSRHAVHVSHEVEARGGSFEAQRWGLLHDASEAYFADVPAPVKRSLPGYTHAEKRFQTAVQESFDLSLASDDERLVETVDSAIGRYELATHFPHSGFEAPALEYDPERLDSSVDSAAFEARARALDLA